MIWNEQSDYNLIFYNRGSPKAKIACSYTVIVDHVDTLMFNFVIKYLRKNEKFATLFLACSCRAQIESFKTKKRGRNYYDNVHCPFTVLYSKYLTISLYLHFKYHNELTVHLNYRDFIFPESILMYACKIPLHYTHNGNTI